MPGSYTEALAFDDYVLGRPKIDRIIIRYILDTNAVVASMLSGDLDVTTVGALRADDVEPPQRMWEVDGKGTVVYRQEPREAWRRLKVRSEKPRFLAILRELAAWREEEAQRRDLPRNRIVKDETLTPVRGQITRLIPQPDVRYGLTWRHVLTVPRRDGLVVQSFAGGEMEGYGETNETPDRSESEEAVRTLAEAFKASA